MCAEHRIRATFDRLASEYDGLKLQVIPGYRQVQDLASSASSRRSSRLCRRVASSSMRTSRSRPIRPSSEPSKEDGAHSCSEPAEIILVSTGWRSDGEAAGCLRCLATRQHCTPLPWS